jgi:electron transfer flavoprotein alpha subunit
MPNTILVVAEQREGSLNRASFETIAAAQSIAKESGWTVEVVLPGNHLGTAVGELAGKAVTKVHALESPALETTPPTRTFSR